MSDLVAIQRRTVRVLALTQAVGAVGITIGITTASLLARDLSGSDAQAGLAQTAQVAGAALAAFVLAWAMGRRGRRIGLAGGYLVGASGALLAVLAGAIGSMPLLLLGALMLGSTTAANSASRYAATDLAAPATTGRDLSTVVWATTIGAVAGPNLSGPAGSLADGVGLPRLTGPFLVGSVGMLAAALVVAVLLRPDPLLLARAEAARKAAVEVGEQPDPTDRPDRLAALRTIATTPVLGWAALGMAAAHAAMVAVMVMTPLHMTHGHADLAVIGVVISLHVLGMYAFSPLVGRLVDRAGAPPVILLGALQLLGAMLFAALSPAGGSWQIVAGLVLLGTGWSFVTVACSTLVTRHAPLAVRTSVQGATDLLMGLTAAGAGGFAGVLVDLVEFRGLAEITLVLVALAALAGLGSAQQLGPAAAASGGGLAG
mgnify:CR=1 FL=1